MRNKRDLLGNELRIVSMGLELFADTLVNLGVPVVHLDWRPPAAGDQRRIELLNRLEQAGKRQSAPD